MWELLGGQFILFIEDGLERANADPSTVEEARNKIRDAFESTTDLELLTGVYTMSPGDHFGQIESRMALITFKDGNKVLLP